MSVSFRSLAVMMAVFLALPASAQSYSYAAPQYFTNDELDQMLAPIALYPDPLLAQILPAASFVDQISQAQSLLRGRVDEGLIESQPWDPSIKAIAHYPDILTMMAQQPDWTAAVGQAYVQQEPDVERSIQRLRREALEAGALQSTPQQQVIVEPNAIQIEPAQPQVIYVPEYNPAELWGYPGGFNSTGLITFGPGLVIGPWLNRDWDWHHHHPYYHGWRGGGWIGANRRYFDTRNNFYLNDQFRNIHVNRNVINRDITGYRSHLERNANFRAKPTRQARPQPAAPPSVAPPVPPAASPAPAPPAARERAQSPPPPPAVAPPPHVAPPPMSEKPQPPPPPPALAPPPHVAPPPMSEKPQPPPPASAPPPHIASPPPAPRPATPTPQGEPPHGGTAPHGGGSHVKGK